MEDKPPPDLDGLKLHNRLLAGELTASAEIADKYLDGIVHYLEQKHPNIPDPHLVETAAIDAVLNYLRRPQQYDPSKASLDHYLRLSARGDLQNLIDQRRRRENAPKAMQVVELDAPSSEYTVEDERTLSVEEQALSLASPLWKRLFELVPDGRDMEIVLLMMENVRSTEDYAVVLGIEHLSPTDQAADVKRHKDRLKKWLQRSLMRSELQDHA
jgi:RNA polymerase sigma-70 factor (ECF subfamily)